MDVIGSEIGLKMRSAIKAKLTELGCYVDDELPDYVMVMVANKRTRSQMEDDLQLFLGDNTELFVNWLHQVLKKLQEVTVTGSLKTDIEKNADKSAAKEKKKKDKDKTKKNESSKKSKKKEKEKARKKEEKKCHKSKKKSKQEIMRPNIPPLLMNMEKESEPSITDVFAGQILKNHGDTDEPYKDEPKQVEAKVFKEIKHPMFPIINPETITSTPKTTITETSQNTPITSKNDGPKDQQIKEINQIEEKIQGLKQKLANQLDYMSDDEDFLNIRTEAEELMNDFAEDVCQDVSQPLPATPPLSARKILPTIVDPKPIQEPVLPQIELNLPKRPIRERLGAKEVSKVEVKEKEKETLDSPERFTPDLEEIHQKPRSSRSRLNSQSEPQRKYSLSDDNNEKPESNNKRLTSKISVLEGRNNRATCASVVLVRPRPRVSAPASSLLLRAVADAHKSLLNTPPKIDTEPPKVQRALVLPMRRMEAQKIVIQVPVDLNSDSQGDTVSLGEESDGEDKSLKMSCDITNKEFIPPIITKVINNTEYVGKSNDTIIDNSTIHNATVDKEKTHFIVTMDGYHPNAFLAKKLKTEGLFDEKVKEIEKEVEETVKNKDIKEKPKEIKEKPKEIKEKPKEIKEKPKEIKEKPKEIKEKPKEVKDNNIQKEIDTKDTEKDSEKNLTLNKRLSDASEESDTQVIIKEHKEVEKRKSVDTVVNTESPPVKKRRASPIVFDVDKKEKQKEKEKEKEKDDKEPIRERTISASSDSVSLTTSSHKYDSLPPLSVTPVDKKQVWCRSFPLCRFGAACAFAHPRCKFAAACTRRGCVYSHAPGLPNLPSPPVLASHVVPAANYKTISSVALPSMCKYYPNCENPACHFYHPKPCRFGKACVNKLECNFYHHDFPTKWNYTI